MLLVPWKNIVNPAYINRSPLYAMRATLVHCECLISRGYYLSAASWFIKMTNDEADLNSGLLLEQVSLSNKTSLYRVLLERGPLY